MRAFTLVSTLITLAIICVLAVVMMYGGFGPFKSGRKDGKGQTIPGTVVLRAKDEVCTANLRQCRQMAMTMSSADPDENMPESLADLKLGHDMTHCKVGGEAYVIDTAAYRETGDIRDYIKCPHPGHEKY